MDENYVLVEGMKTKAAKEISFIIQVQRLCEEEKDEEYSPDRKQIEEIVRVIERARDYVTATRDYFNNRLVSRFKKKTIN